MAGATVGDKLMWELSDATVEVVADHQLKGLAGCGACRIAVEGISLHFPANRAETVHVDVTITTKLLGEFRCKFCMKLLREIAKSVSKSRTSVIRAQDQRAPWSVRHRRVKLLHWRRHGLQRQSLSQASTHCCDIL